MEIRQNNAIKEDLKSFIVKHKLDKYLFTTDFILAEYLIEVMQNQKNMIQKQSKYDQNN